MTGALDPKRIRQIVHDLPDMLAGVAPELPAASMRENLANDPDLQIAATLVAAIARTVRSVPGALRRPRLVTGGPLRSVAIAAKHCEDQVIDLLYQAALGHVMVDAEKHHEFHGTLVDNPPTAPDVDHVAKVWTAIVEGFPVGDTAWRSVCQGLSGMQRGSEMAIGLLDGCESIRPNLAGVGFVSTHLRQRTVPDASAERAWHRYLAGHNDPWSRARAIHQVALLLVRRGSVLAAANAHSLAERWSTGPAAQATGMLIALCLDDARRAYRYLEALSSSSTTVRSRIARTVSFELERTPSKAHTAPLSTDVINRLREVRTDRSR